MINPDEFPKYVIKTFLYAAGTERQIDRYMYVFLFVTNPNFGIIYFLIISSVDFNDYCTEVSTNACSKWRWYFKFKVLQWNQNIFPTVCLNGNVWIRGSLDFWIFNVSILTALVQSTELQKWWKKLNCSHNSSCPVSQSHTVVLLSLQQLL